MPEPTNPETLLAFDFGLKRIGVAIGNTLTEQARPLGIIQHSTRQQRFDAIKALLDTWQPNRLVVGLPLRGDGTEQYSSLQCRRFANQLRGRFNIDVQLVNEWGSSAEAQALLKPREPDDAIAAALILQRYLDQQAAAK